MKRSENQLIRRLPRSDRRQLLALCEQVPLALSQALMEAGAPISQVLFPIDGFVSQLTQLPGHPTLEVGMVGREGMVGVTLALGATVAPVRSVVHGAGSAWRIGSVHFGQQLQHSEALRGLLQRYLCVTLVQMATASACHRFHELGPRLARWLLMSHDRASGDEFHVTHECLGQTLGMRRVGVTVAAGELQAEGLIHYHRGTMAVRNREGLQARACSCYAADLAAYRLRMTR